MSDTDYITHEDSLNFANGKLSYIDYVSDEQIKYFLLTNEDISEEHPLIIDCEDPYKTTNHLERILYQIRQLEQGKSLIDFEVWYEREGDGPNIYDGWHRIRAYQYMKYDKIPCSIIKSY